MKNPPKNPKAESVPIYCIDSFQEKQQEKKADFEIKRVEDIVAHFDFANRPHRHNFYDLLYITEGSGKHFIDFHEYKIKSHTFFFLLPGQVHAWELSPDIKGYSIFFTDDFFSLNRSAIHLRESPFFQNLQKNPVLYLEDKTSQAFFVDIFEKIYQEQVQEETFKLDMVRLYIELLLTQASRKQAQRVSYFKNVSHLQQQAFTYQNLVEKHFLKIRSIQAYADMMSVSAKHLSVICKRVLGKTASEVLHERLLLEAKRLLLYSDETVGQISYRLNFNEVSYFVRFFKKMTKQTPEHFRKKCQHDKG
jgi:AraC-like DNA-binding protein